MADQVEIQIPMSTGVIQRYRQYGKFCVQVDGKDVELTIYAAPNGHFGLLEMRERADLIGARLEVQSEAGRGTRLLVRLGVPSDKSKKEK